MITLTKRQKDAYEFILGYTKANGFGPSYEEITAGIGLSAKSGAHRLVHNLSMRGIIIKHPGMARGYSFPKINRSAA